MSDYDRDDSEVEPIDMSDPETRKRYEEALKKWDKKLQPLIEANRKAEKITADDLNIIVGPCRGTQPMNTEKAPPEKHQFESYFANSNAGTHCGRCGQLRESAVHRSLEHCNVISSEEAVRRVEYALSIVEEDLRRLQQPNPTATGVPVASEDALTHLATARQALAALPTVHPVSGDVKESNNHAE